MGPAMGREGPWGDLGFRLCRAGDGELLTASASGGTMELEAPCEAAGRRCPGGSWTRGSTTPGQAGLQLPSGELSG